MQFQPSFALVPSRAPARAPISPPCSPKSSPATFGGNAACQLPPLEFSPHQGPAGHISEYSHLHASSPPRPPIVGRLPSVSDLLSATSPDPGSRESLLPTPSPTWDPAATRGHQYFNEAIRGPEPDASHHHRHHGNVGHHAATAMFTPSVAHVSTAPMPPAVGHPVPRIDLTIAPSPSSFSHLPSPPLASPPLIRAAVVRRPATMRSSRPGAASKAAASAVLSNAAAVPPSPSSLPLPTQPHLARRDSGYETASSRRSSRSGTANATTTTAATGPASVARAQPRRPTAGGRVTKPAHHNSGRRPAVSVAAIPGGKGLLAAAGFASSEGGRAALDQHQQQQHQQPLPAGCRGSTASEATAASADRKPEKKYTQEQHDFIAYMHVDKGLSWKELEHVYARQFPLDCPRSQQGLNGVYYRCNYNMPALDVATGMPALDPATADVVMTALKVREQGKDGGVRRGLLNTWPERAVRYHWVGDADRERAAETGERWWCARQQALSEIDCRRRRMSALLHAVDIVSLLPA